MVQVTVEIESRTRTFHEAVNAFESQGGVVVQMRNHDDEFVEGGDLISLSSEVEE